MRERESWRSEIISVQVHPSANSISWGICEIFASFENARQMGLRGRLKAQNKFNWDKIAEDTERIYRELAGF